MSKHTSGPWHRNIRPATKYPTIFAGRNTHIAVVDTRLSNKDEVEANIDLIAAAPELLDGLKHLYRAYVSTLELASDRIRDLGGECDPIERMEQGDPALIKTRELIAKATGEPQ